MTLTPTLDSINTNYYLPLSLFLFPFFLFLGLFDIRRIVSGQRIRYAMRGTLCV